MSTVGWGSVGPVPQPFTDAHAPATPARADVSAAPNPSVVSTSTHENALSPCTAYLMT